MISFKKGRALFTVDALLMPIFVLTICTGIALHVTEYGSKWVFWAVFHILSAFLSMVAGGLHIWAHWGWYKGIFARKKNFPAISTGNLTYGRRPRKSRVTLLLTAIFLVELITGIYLIAFVDGANSGVGLWHFALGLLMTVLLTIHSAGRFSILLKGLGWRSIKR